MSISKEDLKDIFGEGGLSFDETLLDSYTVSDVFVSGVRPYCVAYAEDSLQVERFMKLACETKTPVIPVSSGGKHRHGGTVPLREGTVILSLERMKKLLDVNAPFRMIAVEAGVTHGELQAMLKEYGLMADMPLAPKAEKSFVSSLLDGEPRLNPNIQWASFAPLSCVEVTWGDGIRMFTGEAGGGVPDFKKMREDRHITMTSSSGPSSFDYNRMLVGAQGTTGVVTWASLRCVHIPTEHNMFFVASDEPGKLISFMYDLEHVRFGDSLMLLNSAALAALMGKTSEEILKLEAELPKWICAVSFANRPPFPSKRAKAHEIGARRFAERYKLSLLKELSGISAEAFKQRAYNPCEPGKYWKDTLCGAAADVYFMTTMDNAISFVDEFKNIAAGSEIPFSNIGIYIQPRHQGVNCQCEFIIPYDPQNTAEMVSAKKLWERVSERLSEIGAYYSRPIGIQNEIQYGKDHVSLEIQRKLKDIFDPKGIMNPGKLLNYGKEGLK